MGGRTAAGIDIYESGRAADKTAVAAGISAALLLHLAAYCLTPEQFAEFSPPAAEPEELKLEILPPQISKKLPDFVEANPLANTQKPAAADAPESFTDQRAADMITDPSSKSKMPYVEGEIKGGKKIVSGTNSPEDILNPQQPFETLQRPLEQPAQASEFPRAEASPAAPAGTGAAADGAGKGAAAPAKPDEGLPESSENGEKAAASPEKADGKTPSDKIPEGDEGDPAKRASDDSPKKSPTDGAPKAPEDGGDSGAPNGTRVSAEPRPAPDAPPTDESLPAPKPRPYLSMRIPAGPLADNRSRASMQGTIAVDSRFSEFGAYQQRMIEAISRQWNLLGSQYDLNTAVNTIVVIEYSIDKTGALASISVLYSNSTNTGRGLCEQSILTTAPYGEWTREMISALGEQNQDVRITFHYR